MARLAFFPFWLVKDIAIVFVSIHKFLYFNLTLVSINEKVIKVLKSLCIKCEENCTD